MQKTKLIDKKIFSKNYASALEDCNRLLDIHHDDPEVSDLLRKRSDVYNCMRKYEMAYNDRKTIIENYSVAIEDFFFAAYFLLKEERHGETLSYLERGVALSAKTNDSYYIQELQFLSAFAYIRLGEFDKARDQILRLDSEIKMWIDRPQKPYTVSELRSMI